MQMVLFEMMYVHNLQRRGRFAFGCGLAGGHFLELTGVFFRRCSPAFGHETVGLRAVNKVAISLVGSIDTTEVGFHIAAAGALQHFGETGSAKHVVQLVLYCLGCLLRVYPEHQ